MLPQIPQRLLQIDETTRAEHFSVSTSDYCYYIWEYTAGQRYDFSPTNQLIVNLKIKPSQIARSPGRAQHKQRAILHSAAALRGLIQRSWVEQIGTFVPMPGSKMLGDPDYDARIQNVLNAAFAGFNADIRTLLEQTQSTAADHESDARMTHSALRGVIRINEAQATVPPRTNLAIVDDVLTSGKHFKVAQELLSQRYPGIPIIGIFIARCVHSNPFANLAPIAPT